MTSGTNIEEVLSDNLIKECNGIKQNGVHKNGILKNGIQKNGVQTIANGSGKNRYVPINADTKGKLPSAIGTDFKFQREIVWFNAVGFLVLHLLALYGLWLCITSAKVLTILWMLLVILSAGQGITMGAHRMWSHKTFKAKFIVRFVLILLQTVAGQNCLYIWARDHRLHHKYSDTDADPHNSNRGFFFSHMGWLMARKHPAVINKGRTIDMTDLEADPIVMWQKTFYNPLYLIFAISIPVAIPVWLWNETYLNSFFISYMLRYIISLHITWLVNSAAHMFGTKPYDKTMKPVESWIVALLSVGEGWHNYHHAFPWDYRASEYGTRFNITTIFIDILAYFGLVYDLHAAPDHMVQHRALKAGDGSHQKYGPMKIEKDNLSIKQEEKYQSNSSAEKATEDLTLTKQNGNIQGYLEINSNEEKMETDAGTGETITIKRYVNQKHTLKD